jgi:hypothetical protein
MSSLRDLRLETEKKPSQVGEDVNYYLISEQKKNQKILSN